MIYFTAHTINYVCHCIRTMFRVLGVYNFGGWYNFLAYLKYVRSYAWSKGHSDPDLGSVIGQKKWDTLFFFSLKIPLLCHTA